MNSKNNNYISLDVIANKIYKNPILKDTNYEDIIDYAVSVLRILNVPGIYVEESCYKDITEHKVALSKYALNLKTVDLCVNNNLIPMVMSTDSLIKHVNKTKDNKDYYTNNYTYSVNNNILITSEESGRVFITFDTLKLDADNIPMLPDSEALLRAVEAYIKVQIYTVMVDLGKMSERSLDRAEKEYYFNVGKVQSQQQGFTNEDEMESFLNSHTQLFPTKNNHAKRYSNQSNSSSIRKI
jgi:hypothetical protein